MLFRCMTTILLLFCACARVRGARVLIKFEREINIPIPEIGNSCYVTRHTKDPVLYFICPTHVKCYVMPANITKYNSRSFYSAESASEAACKSGASLPRSKKRQLNAVSHFFSLSNESACAFSSIKTLIASDHSGYRNLKLGGRECHSKCPPYQLRDLRLLNLNIGHVSNDSFCQFGQVSYMELRECGISSIDEDAFVDLISLKKLVMSENKLTYLPVNLFRSNDNLESLDVSKNRLRAHAFNALFTINSLNTLIMEHNRVDFSTDRVTCPPNLTYLDVSNNELRRLRSELVGLSELVNLVMNDNSVIEVDEYAFRDLQKVKEIDLERNGIERLGGNAFENTCKLKRLNLMENKLIEFPPIGQLSNLKVLELSHNRISSINKTHLVNCTRLSELHMSYNQLIFIEEGSFRDVWRLKILNLDHSRLSILPVDFKAFNIIELDLSYNDFSSFSYDMVPLIATHVDFSYNQIEKINFGQNRRLTYRYPSSPSNRGVGLTSDDISQAYPDHLIDLRNNRIEQICQNSIRTNLKPFEKLNHLIAENPLRCSSELMWVKDRARFTFIDLDDAYCQSIWPNSNASVRLSQLTSNEDYYRSDNTSSQRCQCPTKNVECDFPCPYNCTCLTHETFTTIHLICTHRQFTRVPSHLKLTSIYYYSKVNVQLSKNVIVHVGKVDFNQLNENVVTLLLSDNHIESIDNNAFDQLTNLTGLNLANNQLKALPDKLFHQLTQLVTLDLSNNQLKHLADDAFTSLVNLNELYLHNNDLNQLKLHQIRLMKSLNNISLHDNPWSCDCIFIKPFQVFLLNSSTPVYKKVSIDCYENDQKFNIPNLNIEHCFKQVQLVYIEQSTILISTLTIGVALIIIAGLVFKWRYELQVMVYSRYGLRMFHRRQPEDAQGKQYDAFMAYNSKDEDFLVEQLLPGLEQIDRPYRILIHERDFLAGGFIQDNILEAVKISSRTIIILTKNFVNSGWCRYEFKTAHAQMLEDQCPRVLVIVVGDIPDNVDPEMQLYLKTYTYLKWGERLFWQKLYYAMPDRRVTFPPTNTLAMKDL